MRSLLRHIVGFALAGALATIAVAWALAVLVQPPGNAGNPLAQGFQIRNAVLPLDKPFGGWATHWHVRELHRWGATDIVVAPITEPGTSNLVPFEDLLPANAAPLPTAEAHADGPGDKGRPEFFVWDGRGWPCIALSSEWPWFAHRDWPQPALRYGIPFGSPPPPQPWPYGVNELRALPLRPNWPGFLVDTVVFGAALWLLPFSARALRAWRRRRQGMCGRCGHRLSAGQGRCPECGAEVSVRPHR